MPPKAKPDFSKVHIKIIKSLAVAEAEKHALDCIDGTPLKKILHILDSCKRVNVKNYLPEIKQTLSNAVLKGRLFYENGKYTVPNQEQKYFERRNLIESQRIARKRAREQEGITDDGAPASKKKKNEKLSENTQSTSYNQVTNPDYLSYYVYQNEWKPTRPIHPIGAMSSSPGPAIVNLPTTIGEKQHDPTRPKAPGYKIGQRILEDKGQGIRPGPGTYCIHNVTNKGKGAVFAPKFGRAKHFNEKLAGYGGSPKPETYKRDSEDKLFYPRAPTYSMPHAERNKTKIGIGAPNLQRTQQSLDNLPFRTWNNSSTHVQSHVTPTSSFIPSCSPWLPNKLQPLQPSYNRLSWNTLYEAAPTNMSMAMQDVKNSVGACGPLGGILEYKGQGIEPGPGTYCIRDVTNNGKGAVIAPKFDPAKRFNEKLAGYGGSTGPAAYKRDSAGKLIYPGAPTYSVPNEKRRETKIEIVPSPNANNLPPLLGKGGTLDIKGPKYSFGKDECMRKAKLEQVACKKHADCRYHKKKKK